MAYNGYASEHNVTSNNLKLKMSVKESKPFDGYKMPYQESIADLQAQLGKKYYDNGIDNISHYEHINKIENDYVAKDDYTLFSHNYLGPGTNIIKNLREQVMPVDMADNNAMMHDVAYATSKNEYDMIDADLDFVKNRIPDAENALAYLSLTAKNILGIGPHIKDYGLDENDITIIKDYANRLNAKFNKSIESKINNYTINNDFYI